MLDLSLIFLKARFMRYLPLVVRIATNLVMLDSNKPNQETIELVNLLTGEKESISIEEDDSLLEAFFKECISHNSNQYKNTFRKA